MCNCCLLSDFDSNLMLQTAGSFFFLFVAPVLIISVLAFVYIIISGEEEFSKYVSFFFFFPLGFQNSLLIPKSLTSVQQHSFWLIVKKSHIEL